MAYQSTKHPVELSGINGRSTRSEAEQQQPVVSGTQFYKQCIDCGKFVPKGLWIPKSHPTYRGAMCRECLSNYDGPEYH